MKRVKLITIIVLTIIVGILIVQNIAMVQANLLFMKVELPLVMMLLLTALIGFLIGLLVGGLFRTPKKS